MGDRPTGGRTVRRAGGRGGRRLPRSFFDRDPREVGPELLNKLLVHDGVSGRIVEVEAYLGAVDPGSHAFRGRTPRNAVMFGPPGHLYVYFTYGMHWCANAVCWPDGTAGAVLLRALDPVEGVDVMHTRRGPAARRARDLCSGPAKLCQALALGRAHNGVDLTGGPVAIVDDGVAPPADPGVSGRIGLRRGAGDDRPWRFYVAGDPNVTR